MKVSDAMTKNVVLTRPDQSIQEAAHAMAELDAGALPVGEGDRLVGMLTDRDIAIRAVARGSGPDTEVRAVMTPEVRYCFDDENREDVARNMGDVQLRRLPVLDRSKRLVGIISLGDLALAGDPSITDDALLGISEPGGGPPAASPARTGAIGAGPRHDETSDDALEMEDEDLADEDLADEAVSQSGSRH